MNSFITFISELTGIYHDRHAAIVVTDVQNNKSEISVSFRFEPFRTNDFDPADFVAVVGRRKTIPGNDAFGSVSVAYVDDSGRGGDRRRVIAVVRPIDETGGDGPTNPTNAARFIRDYVAGFVRTGCVYDLPQF